VKAVKLVLQWLMFATIALVIVELALRIFALGSTYNVNPTRPGHLFIPGKMQISIKEGYGVRTVNEYGTFDRLAKAVPDSCRFLLFGDSMTEAFQVNNDQVFDNVAEDRFADACGASIEIVNCGRSGYATIDEIVFCRFVKDKIPHRYVLLQFSSGDVIENFLSVHGYSDGEIQPRLRSERDNLVKRAFWFAKWNSVLLSVAHSRYQEFMVYLKSWISGRVVRKIDDERSQARHITEQQKSRLVDLLTIFLREIRSMCAELIVVQIVDHEETIGSYQAAREFCQANGVPYYNLNEHISADDRSKLKTGFMNTKLGVGHLNVQGHQIYGSALASVLCMEIRP